MAERFLDVCLEFNPFELYLQPNPTRVVAEIAREKAEAEAASRGVTLRHPEPVDVYSRNGVDGAGKSVLLVATRWVTDGAD